jgi:hypothetical protein
VFDKREHWILLALVIYGIMLVIGIGGVVLRLLR